MEDIKKKIDEAFRLISSIYVSQNDVEVMATAKVKLRQVYAAIEKMEARTDGRQSNR